MSEIVILEGVLWGASVALNVALVFWIFYRGNHRVYPFFCMYAVSAVLQNIAFFASYRISAESVRVAWGTQAFVTMARALAVAIVGLLLYSGFRVLKDTMWGRWLNHYTALWGLLGTFTFMVSLLLWTWALRVTAQRTIAEPQLLPESHYRSLSPAINARLRALNNQLDRFWQPEGGGSLSTLSP